MQNFKKYLFLTIFSIITHPGYSDAKLDSVNSGQSSVDTMSTRASDSDPAKAPDKNVNAEQSADNELTSMLNDAFDAEEGVSTNRGYSASISDDDIAAEQTITKLQKSKTDAPTAFDEDVKTITNSAANPVNSSNRDMNQQEVKEKFTVNQVGISNNIKGPKEDILGSAASASNSQKKEINHVSDLFTDKLQVEIAQATIKAVSEFDFNLLSDPFISAHNRYKTVVDKAELDGETLKWFDKVVIGAPFYGGAYVNVMLTIASKTIKVGGPIVAKMFLMALLTI